MSLHEELVLKQLREDWKESNRAHFSEKMRCPEIRLHRGLSRLGYYESQGSAISISEDMISGDPWYRVIAVLKHEMIHQYIHEVLKESLAPPHGVLFMRVQEDFKIETYEEVGLGETDEAKSSIVDKVRKLLALAGSSNKNEAEVAMRKANQVMLKWNIDLQSQDEKLGYIYKHLGSPGRINAHLKVLSSILRGFFFVDTIWVYSYEAKINKKGRVLEILGRPENIEIAEYVYHYLSSISEILWKQFKRKSREAHRTNFLLGLYRGFYEKLEAQESHEKSFELIWSGDPKLTKYMKHRHASIRSVRSSSVGIRKSSFDAGILAGREITIHKGVHQHSENRGKLLG